MTQALRIAVVVPQAASGVGWGAENLWAGLAKAFNNLPSNKAEIIGLPSPEGSLEQVLQSYADFAALDLSNFDFVISTKYPVWVVSHPNHVVYLQHTLRGLYDTYPCRLGFAISAQILSDITKKFSSNLVTALTLAASPNWAPGARATAASQVFAVFPEGITQVAKALKGCVAENPACSEFPGPFARACVRLLDALAFSGDRIKRFYAISNTVVNRADYFPDHALVRACHHPSALPVTLSSATQEKNLIVTASRLEPAKRVDLLIQAYRASGLKNPFWIIGNGPAAESLKLLAQGLPGVVFKGRVSEPELIAAYQNALFVPFVPNDEDYGLITVEAFMAGAAVMTTADSGGPTELVEHEINGWVCAPTAQSLAHGFKVLASNAQQTQAWGRKGQERITAITWPRLTATLLQIKHCSANQPTGLLVLNTFPSLPANSGGRLRMHGFYLELSKYFSVHMISLSNVHTAHEVWERCPQEPGRFVEELIPATAEFDHKARRVSERLGVSAHDTAFSLFHQDLKAYCAAVVRGLKRADMVVFSHPYVFAAYETVVAQHPELARPVIYDAHNVEADLKAKLYPLGSRESSYVRDLENRLVSKSALVVTCSHTDAQALQAKTFVVCPNGVELAGIRMTTLNQRLAYAKEFGAAIALFMGSDHGPNHEAVEEIVKASQDKQVARHWRFVVLGSVCKRWVSQWSGRNSERGIYWAGMVSESEKLAWLKKATVGLNPIYSGSGTNLKLPEYAAHGLPIVSTAFGGRGGDWHFGEHFCLIDTALKDSLNELAGVLNGSNPDSVRISITDQVARARIKASQLSWAESAKAFEVALSKILRSRA